MHIIYYIILCAYIILIMYGSWFTEKFLACKLRNYKLFKLRNQVIYTIYSVYHKRWSTCHIRYDCKLTNLLLLAILFKTCFIKWPLLPLRFHHYNASQPSKTVPPSSQIPGADIFARPTDLRVPKGWLIDLINHFGSEGGFLGLLEKFNSFSSPSLEVRILAYNYQNSSIFEISQKITK